MAEKHRVWKLTEIIIVITIGILLGISVPLAFYITSRQNTHRAEPYEIVSTDQFFENIDKRLESIQKQLHELREVIHYEKA